MELEQFSEDETNQIIEYGIERAKVIFISTSIALIMGGLFSIFFKAIIFLSSLSVLRRYAGGYHANTQKRCYIISFIVLILAFLYIRQMENIGLTSLLFQMISLFIILFFAPVENQNRVLEKKEKKRYGIKTKAIAIVLFLIYIILYIDNKPQIAIPIGSAFLVVAISLIAGYIKNRKKKN